MAVYDARPGYARPGYARPGCARPGYARRIGALVATTLLWGAASAAHANDSSFGGQGADLTPLEETRVRMVSERIEIEQVPDPAPGDKDHRAWGVTATYRFDNPTDERVSLQLGFPESRCEPEIGDCVGEGGKFRRMRTTVRGKRVRHRLGEVSRRSEWPRLGRVFLYDVEFAPHEEVQIVHRYVHDRSFSTAFGETLSYLTRTGALWNGPIAHALFIVRIPYVPLGVVIRKGYPARRLLVRDDEGAPVGVTVRAEVRDFVPREDFEVFFLGFEEDRAYEPQFASGPRCPALSRVIDTKGDPLDALLAATPVDTLKLCASAAAARYGGPLPDRTREVLATKELALQELGDRYEVVLPRPHPEYELDWVPEPQRTYVARLTQAVEERAGEHPGAALEQADPAASPTTPPLDTGEDAPAPRTPGEGAPTYEDEQAQGNSATHAPPTKDASSGDCGRCAAAPSGRRPGWAAGIALLLGLWGLGRRTPRARRRLNPPGTTGTPSTCRRAACARADGL